MPYLQRLFILSACLAFSLGASAQFISIPGNISPGYICLGTTVSVPFNAYGTYNAGNVFSVQLSDGLGNFANPTVIGTLSGTASGTITATYPATLAPGGGYHIRVGSSNPVITGYSNNNNLVRNPDTTLVSLTASPNPVCSGSVVTFSGSSNLGGNGSFAYRVRYSWQGYWVTMFTGTLGGTSSLGMGAQPGDSFAYVVTVNAGCIPAHTASSPVISVAVIPTTPASVTIATAASTVCGGTVVNFSATAVNGGSSPQYEWKVNGATAGTNSASFSYAPANGDVVTCALTSTAPCPGTTTVTSNSITMTVLPVVTPSVTISTTTPGICAGMQATYTATAVNGGTNPAYQWRLNGSNAGSNSTTYTFAPANGDVVSCVLTSNRSCISQNPVASNTLTAAVSPYLTPQVSIQMAHDTVCSGVPMLFTALPVNGGGGPSYQWTVDNQPAGSGTDTFSAAFSSNAVVKVMLNSSANCLSSAAASALRTVAVTPSVQPSVSISATPGTTVNAGQPVTFTATAQHGGPVPAYQWRSNGADIPGAVASTYTGSSFSDNDAVTVRLRSGEVCALPDTVSASPLTIHISAGLAAGLMPDYGFSLYPNPATTRIRCQASWPGQFLGKELRLSLVNLLGETIQEEMLRIDTAGWQHDLLLNQKPSRGIYLVRVVAGQVVLTKPVLIGEH